MLAFLCPHCFTPLRWPLVSSSSYWGRSRAHIATAQAATATEVVAIPRYERLLAVKTTRQGSLIMQIVLGRGGRGGAGGLSAVDAMISYAYYSTMHLQGPRECTPQRHRYRPSIGSPCRNEPEGLTPLGMTAHLHPAPTTKSCADLSPAVHTYMTLKTSAGSQH